MLFSKDVSLTTHPKILLFSGMASLKTLLADYADYCHLIAVTNFLIGPETSDPIEDEMLLKQKIEEHLEAIAKELTVKDYMVVAYVSV